MSVCWGFGWLELGKSGHLGISWCLVGFGVNWLVWFKVCGWWFGGGGVGGGWVERWRDVEKCSKHAHAANSNHTTNCWCETFTISLRMYIYNRYISVVCTQRIGTNVLRCNALRSIPGNGARILGRWRDEGVFWFRDSVRSQPIKRRMVMTTNTTRIKTK